MRFDPWLINKNLAQLIELGIVEMREDIPYLTIAGQDAVWKGLTAINLLGFASLRRFPRVSAIRQRCPSGVIPASASIAGMRPVITRTFAFQ